MTDGEALLRAILENPADDTARLVYADWLEEHGGRAGSVRARFIRQQIEGKWPAMVPLTVLVAEESLLGCQPHECGRASLAEGSEAESPDGRNLLYRRGFVAELMMPLAAFLAHAGTMFRAHPIERVVPVCREPLDLPTHHSGRHVRHAPLWDFHATVHWRLVPAGIPWELWRTAENVPGGESSESLKSRSFPSRQAAMDWYSAVCVAYGRELAGLPPLPAEAAAWA